MKTTKLFFVLMTLAMGGLFITSCELIEPACELTCNNGGSANDACDACDCLTGFSGTNCDDEDLCITSQIECLNDGECIDGTCDCADGFEGDDCGILSADKVVGMYSVTTICSVAEGPIYDVDITKSTTASNEIIMKNFNNLACHLGPIEVRASVNGNTLTLLDEFYCMDSSIGFDGFLLSGNGKIDGNTIKIEHSFSFTANGVETSDTCTSTLMK